MSGYGIFAIGCVFGCLVGLLGAGMLAAAYRGEVEREKVEAYCQGVKDGQAAERRWAREGARSGDGGGYPDHHLGDHAEDPEVG